ALATASARPRSLRRDLPIRRQLEARPTHRHHARVRRFVLNLERTGRTVPGVVWVGTRIPARYEYIDAERRELEKLLVLHRALAGGSAKIFLAQPEANR